MKRKLIALLCALAVLTGIFAVVATAAEETDNKRYQVGYSKVDVNPWVQSDYTGEDGIPAADLQDEEGNFLDGIVDIDLYDDGQIISQKIISVPLSGYGTIRERNANNLTDDNGDGEIGLGDGVFTTVTSVTDSWGKTVMYVTLDNINGVSQLTTAVRKAIVERLGRNVISADSIMLSASHSHEAPNLSACYSSWNANMNTANSKATGETTALGVYWLYYIDRVADAAEEAYENGKDNYADMTKGEIDASDVMKDKGYTYTDNSYDNYGEGFGLNFVRHYAYKTVVEKATCTSSGTLTGSYVQSSVSYNVQGDNFGGAKTLGVTTTGPAKENWASSTYYMTRTTVTVEHVSEANDTMYILRFERDEGDPIVLVNWRAHASICGGSTNKNISSDYINALRYRLENNETLFGGDTNYCVGFWQAAAGNINNTSNISWEYKFASTKAASVGYPTITLDTDEDGADDVKVCLRADAAGDEFYESYYNSFATTDDRIYRSSQYGYLLAMVAMECLDSAMTENLDTGSIRTIQFSYAANKVSYSEGQAATAAAWYADYTANNVSGYPYRYTYNNVEYAFNSYYHAETVYNRTNPNTTYKPNGTTTMELNAIMMGEEVALVTGTGELFDRYSSEHTYDNTTDNDWDDIVDEALFGTASYGTPFVLSYSNNSTGYAPNTLAYDYYTDAKGVVAAGTSMGSYEANTTELAQGTGEAVIDRYAVMLNLIKNEYKTYYCPQCEAEVEWKPLTADQASVSKLQSGHYYLYEDHTSGSVQKLLGSKDNVDNDAVQICLDLNGKTMVTTGRTFIVYKASTLSVFDTSAESTGKVISYSGNNNVGGGVFSVASGAALNIYGGTYQFIRTEEGVNEATPTAKGGVLSTSGTTTMYGGTLIGGQLGLAGNDSAGNPYVSTGNGCGGTVSVNAGTFNIFGGKIQSGAAAEGSVADCVYIDNTACRVVLSGNACVDELYVNSFNNACITVKGAYTGTAAFTFNKTLSSGAYVGRSDSADLTDADITVTNNLNWKICKTGSYLKINEQQSTSKAVVTGAIGTCWYSSVQTAIDDCGTGDVVTLLADDLTYARTIENDACIDLNGYDMLQVTVEEGCTLYIKDSKTDDYTVADDDYGRISTVYGDGGVTGMDGYVKVSEDDGVSSHKVDLQIKTLTLRPGDVGMYYKSDFKGDEVVARNVQTYGVALSAKAVPDETNMQTLCAYSWFEDFVGGTQGNNNQATSTILKNIMKPENGYMANKSNAATAVYGRAYILTEDGYTFGSCVSYSLRDALEAVDAQLWSGMESEDKTAVVDMCKQYLSVVNTWNIPNIRAEVNAKIEQEREDNILRILGIGNSYTVDSMHLLYEIYQAENPDKEICLGILYIGGCSLEKHVQCLTDNTASYTYYKIDNTTDGWVTTANSTMYDGVSDEQWDIVTMQQKSADSGKAETYNTDIQTIQMYVSRNLGYQPTFLWNMTWAYAEGYSNSYYVENGTFSQTVMYEAITAAVQEKILPDSSFAYVLPTGTAIQNARTYYTEATGVSRTDLTHLNNLGRYIAAYTWYCMLTGETLDTLALTQLPSSLRLTQGLSSYSETDVAVIVEAIKNAIAFPYKVTQSSYANN